MKDLRCKACDEDDAKLETMELLSAKNKEKRLQILHHLRRTYLKASNISNTMIFGLK